MIPIMVNIILSDIIFLDVYPALANAIIVFLMLLLILFFYYRGPEIPCFRIIKKCVNIKAAAATGKTKVCAL